MSTSTDSATEEVAAGFKEEVEYDIEVYRKVADDLSDELIWNLRNQSRTSSFNVLLQMDIPKTVPAFVYATRLGWEAALCYVIAHGFVEVTDKGMATPEQRAKREEHKAEDGDGWDDVAPAAGVHQHQYL